MCPVPKRWSDLYQLLPAARGSDPKCPVPLILDAWHHTSDREKQDRLELHIRWAAERGGLDEAYAFLRQLSETDWHHIGD